MTMTIRKVAVACSIAFLSACASSTIGPGSGAAESAVHGNVDQVSQRAQQVFQQMNIQSTGSSIANSGSERTLNGKMGGSDVAVRIDSTGASTSDVKVDVSKNFVSGQGDIAKEILNRIVQLS